MHFPNKTHILKLGLILIFAMLLSIFLGWVGLFIPLGTGLNYRSARELVSEFSC